MLGGRPKETVFFGYTYWSPNPAPENWTVNVVNKSSNTERRFWICSPLLEPYDDKKMMSCWKGKKMEEEPEVGNLKYCWYIVEFWRQILKSALNDEEGISEEQIKEIAEKLTREGFRKKHIFNEKKLQIEIDDLRACGLDKRAHQKAVLEYFENLRDSKPNSKPQPHPQTSAETLSISPILSETSFESIPLNCKVIILF